MSIASIKRRVKNSSPGPWHVVPAKTKIKLPSGGESTAEDKTIIDCNGLEVLGCSEWLRVAPGNLKLLANARQDIEYLLSRIEQLEADQASACEPM